jgi:5S rRNA maturation endonuclease (ribonuclease M5)
MPEAGPREPAWPEFVRLFSRLREASAAGTVVVLVEGERDRRSLRRLGVAGPIALVHGGGTLSALAARLALGGRTVVVLTDWDTEGGHLAQRIREFLTADAVGVDLEYRRKLAKALRNEVVHVEGLHGWARRTAEAEGLAIDEVFGDGE